MDLEWSYEIDRTVDYIHSRNFTRIALQFPDELLKDSTRVVRALRDNLRSKKESGCESNGEGREVGLYVMADTAYGSCCVDEVGASHINAECVVHYGHTCLSQTTTLPALFVFGKAPISVSSCIESICNVGSKCDKSIVVLYGLEYAYAVNDIKEAVTVETPALSHSKSKSKIYYADVACSSMEPSKDHVIPNGQINVVRNVAGSNESDSDGHTRCSVGGLTWSLPLGERIEDFLLFWIGSDNSAFANLVLTFNSCEIVRYDAAENRILTDHFQKTRILKRRYYLVEKAKDANIVGILVGTLGVAGYLQMIDQMKQLVTRAGKKPYMLVMGRPNPAKLANFPECDVFIYVSCAQTALLDSKEFLAPVITPFEAMLAFSRGSQWTGQYTIEFRDLISASALEAQCETDEARFSFFHGGYVEDLDDEGNGEDVDEALALALATEKALQVHDKTSRSLVNATPKSGPEFLAARSYQGLGSCDENPTPSAFLIGRTGRASGYEDEKTQERFS